MPTDLTGGTVRGSTRTMMVNGRPVIVPATQGTRYVDEPAPKRTTPIPAPRVSTIAARPGVSTARPSVKASGIPSGWLGQVSAQVTKAAPALKAYTNKVGNYAFKGGGAIGGNVGIAREGDWGLNQAAQDQVALIKMWGAENMAAAAESEISRGMGRSGAYDAAVATEMDKSRLEAASQMSAAAAEAGRINSGIAQSNAANALSREQANQQALLSADQIRSGYNIDLRGANLADYLGNTSTALNYADLNERARQFNGQIALDQTNSNRGYQGQMLDYNEGIRQYDGTLAYNQLNSNRDFAEGQRQYNASLAENTRQFDTELDYNRAIESIKANAQGQQAVNPVPGFNAETQRANAISQAMNDWARSATLKTQYPTVEGYLTASGLR